MRGRKPDKFRLKSKDKTFLRKLLRNGQTPLRVARRAQTRSVLSRADDQHRVGLLGETVGQTSATIWRVCERYRQADLPAALYDAPRSGHPRVFFQPRTEAG